VIPVFITNEGVIVKRHKVDEQPAPEVHTNETSFEELCKVAAKEAEKASTPKNHQ